MPAPVTPTDFKNVVSDPTSSMCGNFINTLLKLPALVYQLVNWMFDADGNPSSNLTQGITDLTIRAGDLIFSASPEDTDGRLICDGAAVSRTTYAALFAKISSTYGNGDGISTFNVPDYRDRFPIGVSGTKVLAATGGEANHTLTAAEMPSHTHGITVTGGGGAGADNIGHTNDTVTTFTDVQQTSATGGGAAHNNMPPWIACYVYIKT